MSVVLDPLANRVSAVNAELQIIDRSVERFTLEKKTVQVVALGQSLAAV
jgi:hypothetical protein